jgi:hypothetical protein
VREVGVHEHIGDKLVNPKVRGLEEMQAKDIGQVDIETLQSDGSQKHQRIDNQQVLDNRRQHFESSRAILFVHNLEFQNFRFQISKFS